MAGDTRHLGVLDELDGIRAARVLRDAGVVEIDGVALVVEDHVFQHAAEAERVENIGLVFRREVDGFGVAAALDVEDAVVAPDVFVVADEPAFRVGGKRGLARAGEAEEHGRMFLLRVGGGRAVHGEQTLLRHEVVHDGEDTLLHFAGVFGAEDDHLPFLK